MLQYTCRCSDTTIHENFLHYTFTVCQVDYYLINTYICTHTHTHFMSLCVTKRVGCGTSHKYTSIHDFYIVKYC